MAVDIVAESKAQADWVGPKISCCLGLMLHKFVKYTE